MAPVGQLSDPYDQGDDDSGISISGLPGDLLGPEPAPRPEVLAGPVEDGDVDEGLGGASISYELEDWSRLERQAVSERLRAAGVPHGWESTQLVVAAVDEAAVDNVLDLVEGAAAGREPLDAGRDQVAYDVEQLEDEQLDAVADALRSAGIAFSWGDEELIVYAEDEAAVDGVFDRVEHPDELAAEEDETPAGTASADLLGDIFVAADRLQHDGDDTDGTASLLEIAVAIDDLDPPYGLGRRDWEAVCAGVGRLADVLAGDALDEEKVVEVAREVRATLRPFV